MKYVFIDLFSRQIVSYDDADDPPSRRLRVESFNSVLIGTDDDVYALL